MRNFRIISIIGLFIIGILLRGQETFSHNFIFLLDQGRDMLAVKSILYQHHLTLIGPYTSLQGVFQGPLWYYLLVVSTFLTHDDPWGAVAFMFVLSISVLIFVFLWSKKEFGILSASIFLLLFVVSPEAISAATFSWNPHPMWFLLCLYCIAIYSVLKGNRTSLVFIWLLVGLMFHFEIALAVYILVSTIIYFLIFKKKVITMKQTYLGLLFLLVTFVPQIIFEIRHSFLMTHSILALFTGSKQGLLVKGESQHINIFKGHFDSFYINFQSSFPMGIQYNFFYSAFFLSLSGVFFWQGRRLKVRKIEQDFVVFLCFIIVAVFLLTLLYPFPIRFWFLTGFEVFYLFLLGLYLSIIFKTAIGKVTVILLSVILLLFSFQKLHSLYITPVDSGGTQKIKGKLSAVDYIYDDAHNKPFGLFTFTPPVYTDSYDYLLWWRAKIKYHYLPYHTKNGIIYLLIEPDPAKPWSYKGWLETVIKTGTIEKTVELPSGFIIQKRYENPQM